MIQFPEGKKVLHSSLLVILVGAFSQVFSTHPPYPSGLDVHVLINLVQASLPTVDSLANEQFFSVHEFPFQKHSFPSPSLIQYYSSFANAHPKLYVHPLPFVIQI